MDNELILQLALSALDSSRMDLRAEPQNLLALELIVKFANQEPGSRHNLESWIDAQIGDEIE